MGWFDERQKGDILAILNDDVNQLERFLDKGANDFLQVSTTVIVVGACFCLSHGKLLCSLSFQYPSLFGVRSDIRKVWSRDMRRFENLRVR